MVYIAVDLQKVTMRIFYAVKELFETVDSLEDKLGRQRFLGGDGTRFTWLDLRLFPTPVSFDPVYIYCHSPSEDTVTRNVSSFRSE